MHTGRALVTRQTLSLLRRIYRPLLLAALLIALAPSPAWAYIGPGAGFALAGSFFAVFAAVFSAFVTVLTWPVAPADAGPVRLACAARGAGSSGS